MAAADDLLSMASSLHEIQEGPQSSADKKRELSEGPGMFHTMLSTDSMSIVSALTATTFRIPREKGLTIPLYWLKEKLTLKTITQLQWLDTRDITCDGHTKGSVERTFLKQLQQGF